MENTKTLMAQFYSQCQENGYTDMDDATQSLKAKMIAMELKLDYRDIVSFYQEAKHCFEQVSAEQKRLEEEQRIQQQKEAEEAARRAVDGQLLATLYDTKNGRSKSQIAVYQRPDESIYYTIGNGKKIEGVPEISVHKGGTLQYTYHPSQAVYTGATVGGVTTGGVHHTEASYSERVNSSDKGYFSVTVRDTSFAVFLVELSDYTCSRFARDETFARYVKNKRIICYDVSAESSPLMDILRNPPPSMSSMNAYDRMSLASRAADEQRLPFHTSAAQAKLVGQIIHAQFPPTDEAYYNKALTLAQKDNPVDLKQAVDLFMLIRDYRDAAEQAVFANDRYQDILKKEEAAAKKRAKRNIKIALIAIPIAVIVILLQTVFIPSYKAKQAELEYHETMELLASYPNYEKKLEQFVEIDFKQDISKERVLDAICAEANKLLENGETELAVEAFAAIGKYAHIPLYSEKAKDARNALVYAEAGKQLAEGNYEGALDLYDSIWAYEDSADQIKEIKNRQAYDAAIALRDSGKKKEAYLALKNLGEYGDADKQAKELLDELAPKYSIAAGGSCTVGVRRNGTVVVVGDTKKHTTNTWTNIVSVAVSSSKIMGLKADGTVVVVARETFSAPDVSDWDDIVSITQGDYYIVGLRADGTVVATNDCDNKWSLSNWTDIIAVAAGSSHTVGLKVDGTVVADHESLYRDEGQCDVSQWTDITAIAAGSYHTVGLKADGTVVAVGYNNEGQCDVSRWTDIIAIAAGGYLTVGLKADGTVVVAGSNIHGACNVSNWTDIVAIAADGHTVGLKSDGTVVAIGMNDYSIAGYYYYLGCCDVSDWTNIRTPN